MFYNAGSKTLEPIIQESGGCPIAGNIQGQVGCGYDLFQDVPAHCREAGLDDLSRFSFNLLTQTIL